MSSCGGCPYTLFCHRLGVGSSDWVNFFKCSLCEERFVIIEVRGPEYRYQRLVGLSAHRCPWGYLTVLCPDCKRCIDCRYESKDCMPRVRCSPAKLESDELHARETNAFMKAERRYP